MNNLRNNVLLSFLMLKMKKEKMGKNQRKIIK